MKTVFAAALISGLLLAPLGAQVQAQSAAQCREPKPPTRLRPLTLPREPSCASAGSCTDTDVETYNASIERFNNQQRTFQTRLDAYVGDLNVYVQQASQYRECEITALRNGLNGR